MKKLRKLPKKEIAPTAIEIIKSIVDFQRTAKNIDAAFQKKGLVPPSNSTIYRLKTQIQEEEQREKHARENGTILEKEDLVSLSKILAVRNIKEEIGEEQFKQILSLIM